ncbi:MAG: GyrI-like domain-containing protein [Candidatus Obscuribacterales bacterium]|nr:GyrI-like domain-containing protein [Candidatus Obscuribacterales bacterium]
MPITLSTPQIIKTKARHIAFIHVVVPRVASADKLPANTEAMKDAIHCAFQELFPVLQAQNIEVTGPWFAHHLRKPTDTFDFEISLPVSSAVTPVGRIEACISPVLDAVQTIYTGPYEGLPDAWHSFLDWTKKNGHNLAEHFYEIYTKGPGQSVESPHYQTELIGPLAKDCYVG